MDILNQYLRPGVVIQGRYTLEHPIGGGAYGVIYSAVDSISHERLAIKALPPAGTTGSRTAHGRFMREMKVIESLRHPNIVTIYDYGETEQSVPFMVLEYVQGNTLERVVANNPMGFIPGVDALRQIASALAAAHEKGIIHRDLKPANIMVVPAREDFVEIKVLDFGMAKMLTKLGDESIVALTREGVAVGTPRYIAPEQARGLQVGPYTDVYALGLLTYEIFTGQRAVKESTIAAAVALHVSPNPLPLPELEQVPQAVRPIMARMLEKDASRRIQHAGEVVAFCEQLLLRHRQASLARPHEAPSSFAPHVDATQIVDVPSGGLDATEVLDRPFFPEDAARHQQRVQQQAPPQQPGFIPGVPQPPQQPKIDLDYDHIDRFEQAHEARQAARMQQAAEPKEPGWREALEARTWTTEMYAEAALAIPLGLLAFTVFTAPFTNVDVFALRVALGAMPLMCALGVGVALPPQIAWMNPPRMVNVASLALIAFAHLFNLKTLVRELAREPIWYLVPVRDVPGLAQLYDLLTALARWYATAMYSIIS